jgi:hypothetical protein
MADSDASVSSWPGFVDQLNKTFMLVRDAFGYALPGAIFLGIGLISRRFSMRDVSALLSPYQVPPWMAFLGIVIICYAVGSVMAAITYSPLMVFKFLVWFRDRHWPEKHQSPPRRHKTFRTWCTEWLGDHPTEVSKESLKIRIEQPKLIDTLDRRETLNLLSASLTGSLIAGWVVFCQAKTWGFSTILGCAAVFAALQFLTGLPHLRRVTRSTCDAYEELEKKDHEKPDAAAQSLHDLSKAAQSLIAALRVPGSPP